MRVVAQKEKTKRGCVYCMDYAKKRLEPDSTQRSWVCIHDECPYHELDPYDNYVQYLKSPRQSRLQEALEKIFNFDRGMPSEDC